MEWKASSLQCMTAGDSNIRDLVFTVDQGGQILQYSDVDRMMVLCVILNTEGATSDNMEYSLQAAEVNYSEIGFKLGATRHVQQQLSHLERGMSRRHAVKGYGDGYIHGCAKYSGRGAAQA